jgi:hypothetical protein
MFIDVFDEALSVLEPEPDNEDTELIGTIIWNQYTIKLLVFKASVAEQRMSCAPFVTVF